MRANQLRIAEPCNQDWDAMKGGPGPRYCDHCDETVHDLSTMTRAEASELLSRARCDGAELCVYYTHDAGGAVLFAPDLRRYTFSREPL